MYMTSECQTAPVAGSKRLAVYREIAAELRRWIADSSPGDMLPSEASLTRRFKVNLRTVRQALDVLAQEGSVRRHHGRGTVVLDRKAVGEVAVVLRSQALNSDAHPYYGLMNELLVKRIQERNPRWHVKLHFGRFTETGAGLPATLDLLTPDVLRNLRGVFTFHALYDLATALQARQIPVVALAVAVSADVMQRDSVRHCVWFDLKSIYTLGIPLLREAGCRNVGVIWGAYKKMPLAEQPIYRLFMPILQAQGLVSKMEWNEPFTEAATERAGYEAFMRLWRQPSRPNGLLVADDVVCRGVLRAALHLGIDIPGQLRLVTQANAGVEFPYHKPITRVEFDPAKQAQLATDMMETLLCGGMPPAAYVPLSATVIRGQTT